MIAEAQAGILVPVPAIARHMFFGIAPGADVRAALRTLGAIADGDRTVVGIGRSSVLALGREVPGLEVFPRHAGPGFDVPSTPAALWCWLRGKDRGELTHRARSIEKALAPAFNLDQAIDAFRYGSGRDLTGYEDGTENPKGRAAVKAAIVAGRGAGLDGSSFAAVQQWVHDFDKFGAMTAKQQDNVIGRRRSDNAEIGRAPASAHVKRTEQESFDPAAFVLRRSMPWADERRAGLVFLAFGRSFDAFEVQLRRMVGAEDGIVDAMFRFTRPVTGAYYWCPPLRKRGLDLRAVGL